MPIGKASNQQLKQAEQALAAKIPQQLRPPFAKVIASGLQILYSPKLREQLARKLEAGNPVKDAADGGVRLTAELFKQSNGTLPKPLVVPAVMIFAFEYLDLAEKAGKLKVDAKVIAETARLASENVLRLAGLTDDKLRKVTRAAAGQKPGLVEGRMEGEA